VVDAAHVPGDPYIDDEDARTQTILLDAFTPNVTNSSAPSMDMNNILSGKDQAIIYAISLCFTL
jgi:hypothetical protein